MKTALSPTLTLYIGGRFFAWLLGVSVLLGCITLLGDSIELLRRSADKPDVTFALVMLMAILKLPATAQEVMPFGLLAATLGCLTQLSRTSELIIVRASGASIWQVLLPALLLGLVVGVLRVGAFDSLAASSTERYRADAEAIHEQPRSDDGDRQHLGALAAPGLGHGRAMSSTPAAWTRPSPSSTRSSCSASTPRTISCGASMRPMRCCATRDGFSRTCRSSSRTSRRSICRQMTVPAKLTYDQLMESFAAASTLSFWQLPGFISILEASGLPSRAHRLKYQRLLATPLLFVGIILLATSFGLRLPRFGGLPLAIGAGAMSGFLLYFLSSLAAALGVEFEHAAGSRCLGAGSGHGDFGHYIAALCRGRLSLATGEAPGLDHCLHAALGAERARAAVTPDYARQGSRSSSPPIR